MTNETLSFCALKWRKKNCLLLFPSVNITKMEGTNYTVMSWIIKQKGKYKCFLYRTIIGCTDGQVLPFPLPSTHHYPTHSPVTHHLPFPHLLSTSSPSPSSPKPTPSLAFSPLPSPLLLSPSPSSFLFMAYMKCRVSLVLGRQSPPELPAFQIATESPCYALAQQQELTPNWTVLS